MADDTGRSSSQDLVLSVIARRRTARGFDPNRDVPDEVLESLLRAAMGAPSGFNLQPWRFLVVREPSNRRRLRACTFGEVRITEAPVVVIVLGYLHPHRTDLDAVIAEQRARGLLSEEDAARLRAMVPRDVEWSGDLAAWASRWAMAAATTLMIAAEAQGVASAAIDGFDPAKLRRGFGIPNDHVIATIVALGYAAETPPFPGRMDLSQVGYREHFGQPWSP